MASFSLFTTVSTLLYHFSDLLQSAKPTTFFGGFLNIPVGDDWGKAPIYSQGWTATHVASKVPALQEPQIEEAMPPLFGLRPVGSSENTMLAARISCQKCTVLLSPVENRSTHLRACVSKLLPSNHFCDRTVRGHHVCQLTVDQKSYSAVRGIVRPI